MSVKIGLALILAGAVADPERDVVSGAAEVIRLIPDWLLYIVVIAAVVFVLFRVDQRSDAPEALPDATAEPAPSCRRRPLYDPEVLVEVGPRIVGPRQRVRDLAGRLVADSAPRRRCVRRASASSCRAARRRACRQVRVAQFADLALLQTERAPRLSRSTLSERNSKSASARFTSASRKAARAKPIRGLIGRETPDRARALRRRRTGAHLGRAWPHLGHARLARGHERRASVRRQWRR